MNEEAEKYADHVALWGDFYDPPEGDYQGCAKTEEIKQAILEAMRWAYADAAKVCRENMTDPKQTLFTHGDCCDGTSLDIARAIEARAK